VRPSPSVLLPLIFGALHDIKCSSGAAAAGPRALSLATPARGRRAAGPSHESLRLALAAKPRARLRPDSESEPDSEQPECPSHAAAGRGGRGVLVLRLRHWQRESDSDSESESDSDSPSPARIRVRPARGGRPGRSSGSRVPITEKISHGHGQVDPRRSTRSASV
jgi:hypothetical protein